LQGLSVKWNVQLNPKIMDHPIPHDDATIVALQHDLLSARERLTGRRTFDADLAALESSINAMRAA
jgi:hypothetical protein